MPSCSGSPSPSRSLAASPARTRSTVGKASRIRASPSSGRRPRRASRQTWSTNFGPRSFQRLTSWKRYQLGRWNGSSAGPPTSWGTVQPTLRGACQSGRLDRPAIAGSSYGHRRPAGRGCPAAPARGTARAGRTTRRSRRRPCRRTGSRCTRGSAKRPGIVARRAPGRRPHRPPRTCRRRRGSTAR